MDLILWRHAEAFEMREVQSDLERALTPKGERQAQRMAGWLNRQLPASTRVLVSPARRAQQTAAALDRKVKTLVELAPDGTVDALLHAVRWPEAREPVLVVGHQPTLGLTAAYLLSGQAQSWALRKGGLWWLRARQRDGELQVVLHAALAPELV
ncbi:phosphohistidine phosphatase SixA [Rubrivivax sp. RP6-9]|uniref:phosphohistidine phosphatase SixA n=1 Tax=Rubrivivax sp. RP6-9 TaxID=3415750 RepID=UPI003CC5EC41